MATVCVTVRYMSHLARSLRGESRVSPVYHERFLQQSPSAEETRPDRSDRDAEHGRCFIVCHSFDVYQHDGRPKDFGQLSDCALERRPQIDTAQDVDMFRGRTNALLRRCQRFELRIITAVIHTTAFSFPKTQKNISTDGEEPFAALAARLEGVPGSVCTEEGLLDYVVGVGFIAGHGERESVDVIEPGQRFNLEASRVHAMRLGCGYRSVHEGLVCSPPLVGLLTPAATSSHAGVYPSGSRVCHKSALRFCQM